MIGINTVKHSVEDNTVFINDNVIASHIEPERGSFFVTKAPVGTFKTNIKHLSLLSRLGLTEYAIYDVPGNEIFYAQGMCGSMPIRAAISAKD